PASTPSRAWPCPRSPAASRTRSTGRAAAPSTRAAPTSCRAGATCARRRCARRTAALPSPASSTTTSPRRSGTMPEEVAPLLEVRELRKHYPVRRGPFRRVVGHVRAVDDVSFQVRDGEILSLVGESGCGKTTTAKCVLRAVDPTSGEVLFRLPDGRVVDVARLPEPELRPLRSQMQLVFQDPFGSLNPRMNLLDIIGEPLLVHGVKDRRKRMERV